MIRKPLTNLLKNDACCWSEQTHESFGQLKRAMTLAPTLVLPDFSKIFTMETNECLVGIDAVLMQEGHPIAYISKALAERHMCLSVYDKELMSIVFAVENGGIICWEGTSSSRRITKS